MSRSIARTIKIAAVLAGIVVLGGLASSQYWERMRTMWTPETEYDQTAGGRTEIWKTALKLMASAPWGVGVAGFDTAEGLSHEGKGKWSAAHNSFLQIGTELGVLGLVVFVVLLGSTFRDLRRVREAAFRNQRSNWRDSKNGLPHRALVEESVDLARLTSALQISLSAYVVGGFFLSQAYAAVLYVLLALSVCCRRLAEPLFEARGPAMSGAGLMRALPRQGAA